eukprot:gnl/TRDRNA2_/TRDRNA2_172999_c4_seq22.p1 gnl/TRDRNA2_/TRDRNA2_172999_c4~~gnl/TRDRNA2_/TRDRNA2_172999_c4_seq22.p1  ORF type:complete len:606 (-),score=93.26 gnl/TRDRNA2_/TRDRNA2_172999_c4_seq22:52-1869(-)
MEPDGTNASHGLQERIMEQLQQEFAILHQGLQAELSRQVAERKQECMLLMVKALKEHSLTRPQMDQAGLNNPQTASQERQMRGQDVLQTPTSPLKGKVQTESPGVPIQSEVAQVRSESKPSGNEENTTSDIKDEEADKPKGSEFGTLSAKKKAKLELEKKMKAQPLLRLINSQSFELASGGLIIANTMVMALAIQYNGFQAGYELNIQAYDSPKNRVWPGAETAFSYLNAIFNIGFIVELFIRLAALKIESFKSGWMWFDGIIVSLGTLDWLGLGDVGFPPSLMRLVRLLRLLRMLKLLQKLSSLEALFVLIRSIKASMGALFWSFILLSIMQVMCALLLCQLLAGFIADETQDEDQRKWIFNYFGTFTNALVSSFELSLANWVPICRFLKTNVSEWWALFLVVWRCMVCFAVVKTITAVFISETNKAASEDMDIIMMKKAKERAKYCGELKKIFVDLDSDASGTLDRTEFAVIVQDDYLKAWFGKLQIDVADLDHLFDIFDDGDGNVDIEEFVEGVHRMRGYAKSMDVLALVKMANTNRLRIDEIVGTLKRLPDLISGPRMVNSMPAPQAGIKSEVEFASKTENGMPAPAAVMTSPRDSEFVSI